MHTAGICGAGPVRACGVGLRCQNRTLKAWLLGGDLKHEISCRNLCGLCGVGPCCPPHFHTRDSKFLNSGSPRSVGMTPGGRGKTVSGGRKPMHMDEPPALFSHGVLDDWPESDTFADKEPGLSALYSASIAGTFTVSTSTHRCAFLLKTAGAWSFWPSTHCVRRCRAADWRGCPTGDTASHSRNLGAMEAPTSCWMSSAAVHAFEAASAKPHCL
jgi:hypothetical protein